MSHHPRRNQRVDNNQKMIVDALRTIPGVSVEPGHDDILVGYNRTGLTYWYEIKNEDAVSKKTGAIKPSELTKTERDRILTWPGHYRVVWKLEQILEDMGIGVI